MHQTSEDYRDYVLSTSSLTVSDIIDKNLVQYLILGVLDLMVTMLVGNV